MNRVLLAASTAVIAVLAVAAVLIAIRHSAGPTEDEIVASALDKHRSRGETVTERQLRDAYETLLRQGLSTEIAAICLTGNWSECAQFRSDEEEAISVAHKIKAPLGYDVPSQQLSESYRAFIAHGVSPVQARKCLVFFNPAHCPL